MISVLGRFANLDGEMVVLDGAVYQVFGTGQVSEAKPDAGAPFAVVTRFSANADCSTAEIKNYKQLKAFCDQHRTSGNIFYALRLDGHFNRVQTRAVNLPSKSGCVAGSISTAHTFGR